MPERGANTGADANIDTGRGTGGGRVRGGGFDGTSRREIAAAAASRRCPSACSGSSCSILLILGVEIGTRTGVISNLTLPIPSEVFATFVELWRSGLFLEHLRPVAHAPRRWAPRWASRSASPSGTAIGLFSLVRAGLVPAGGRAVPGAQDRAAAAVRHLVRHRRGLEVRADRVRHVHPDGGRDLRRRRQRRPGR